MSFNCDLCRDSGWELVDYDPDNPESIQQFRFAVGEKYFQEVLEVYQDPITGILQPSQPTAIKCRRCNGALKVRQQQFEKRSNIPAAYYNNVMKDFDRNIYGEDISQKMKIVDSFVNDFIDWEVRGAGLYIFSAEKGTGKTFLASCICNELMKKFPLGTKFVQEGRILDMIANYKKQNDYSKDNPVDIFKRCRVLVIDDLGQSRTGVDWREDEIFGIVNERYQNKKVTIITSNYPLEQLPYDDRVADRINAMCTQIMLPPVKVRGQKAEQTRLDFLKEKGIL